jgi:CRP/FNR family transcriptional regulator
MLHLHTPSHTAAGESLDPYPETSSSPPLRWQTGKRNRSFAKEVLYRERDPVECVCLIRKGLVKLLSYLPNGRARIVRLHHQGDYMGLEGLLDQPYEHTAIAVGDVEVEHFLIPSLQRFHREHPMTFIQLMRQWHGDRSQADKWILDFSTGEIKPRVARLIAYLAWLGADQAVGMVELLTVDEMAEILGVTPESVSRHLADFKRNAVLHKQPDPRRDLYRFDSEKLRREVLR